MKAPHVTVLTAVRNGAPYLAETIEPAFRSKRSPIGNTSSWTMPRMTPPPKIVRRLRSRRFPYQRLRALDVGRTVCGRQ